jgi:hypothetical protein
LQQSRHNTAELNLRKTSPGAGNNDPRIELVAAELFVAAVIVCISGEIDATVLRWINRNNQHAPTNRDSRNNRYALTPRPEG